MRRRACAPAALWSSDCARARETAAYVAKETGLDPTYDARLREYYLGDRQGLTHDEYAALAPEEYRRVPRAATSTSCPAARPPAQVVRADGRRRCGSCWPRSRRASRGVAGLPRRRDPRRCAVLALLGWPVTSAAGPARRCDNCGWVELDQAEPGGRCGWRRTTGSRPR